MAERKRPILVGAWVNQSERALIDAAVQIRDTNVSGFARKAVLNAATETLASAGEPAPSEPVAA